MRIDPPNSGQLRTVGALGAGRRRADRLRHRAGRHRVRRRSASARARRRCYRIDLNTGRATPAADPSQIVIPEGAGALRGIAVIGSTPDDNTRPERVGRVLLDDPRGEHRHARAVGELQRDLHASRSRPRSRAATPVRRSELIVGAGRATVDVRLNSTARARIARSGTELISLDIEVDRRRGQPHRPEQPRLADADARRPPRRLGCSTTLVTLARPSYARAGERRAARKHQTRSRANPGGMDVLKVLGSDVRPLRERKPSWFKVPAPGGKQVPRAAQPHLRREPQHGLPGGRVPEHRRLLGARHRDVHDPRRHVHAPLRVLPRQDRQADVERPARARPRRAHVAKMGLRYAVVTSVDRDDLPDKGARIWAATIRQIRRQAPDCKVEVLTPDFQGHEMPLATVIAERPDVFNHNVEVAPRLYPLARRGSTWERSNCACCATPRSSARARSARSRASWSASARPTRRWSPRSATCASSGVDFLTVGQYLRPSEAHLPVVRYWHPDEFKALEAAAYALGFEHVAAGPLVRSSYHADEAVKHDQPGVGPLAAAG